MLESSERLGGYGSEPLGYRRPSCSERVLFPSACLGFRALSEESTDAELFGETIPSCSDLGRAMFRAARGEPRSERLALRALQIDRRSEMLG